MTVCIKSITDSRQNFKCVFLYLYLSPPFSLTLTLSLSTCVTVVFSLCVKQRTRVHLSVPLSYWSYLSDSGLFLDCNWYLISSTIFQFKFDYFLLVWKPFGKSNLGNHGTLTLSIKTNRNDQNVELRVILEFPTTDNQPVINQIWAECVIKTDLSM